LQREKKHYQGKQKKKKKIMGLPERGEMLPEKKRRLILKGEKETMGLTAAGERGSLILLQERRKEDYLFLAAREPELYLRKGGGGGFLWGGGGKNRTFSGKTKGGQCGRGGGESL